MSRSSTGRSGSKIGTSHVLADPSTTRENLYVAMTRGRHANLVYVATDRPDGDHTTPHPADDPDVTARSVLYGVLQHVGAELSAHETITAEQEAWSSVAQLVAEYETIAQAAQHDRFATLIRQSGLTSDEAEDTIHSDAFGALSSEMRRAEANHHNIDTLIPRLVAARGFGDADDISSVLHHRLARATARPAGSGRTRKAPQLIAGLIPEATDLAHQASSVRRSLESIQVAASALDDERLDSSNTILHDPALNVALDRTVQQVRHSVSEAQALIGHLDELLETQRRLKSGVDLLQQQLQLAQEQIGDAWESVALGLSAEALSHEVQHISDGLRGRSAQITQYLKSIESDDQRIWTYVEHVRSSASALGQQVSRITPSLRYMRERRTDVVMSDLVQRLTDYYGARWGSNGLRIEVNLIKDFEVRANEGKLTQVFDNLILNSEYWLLQQLAAKQIDRGVVAISIDGPFVTVEDNGIGVDESIEELAFDPFITTKPSQAGRGLGLFVVRQLLDSMNATIVLAPERNLHGRRFRFRLSFGGSQPVMQEGAV